MKAQISSIFEDRELVKRIKEKLPKLFQIAEIECSRAGKIGMEVGSVREQILIGLLVYKFSENNIDTEVPIAKSEIDVIVSGEPLSIKTCTGISSIKVSWTVDAETAKKFYNSYKPSCDLLLTIIKWGDVKEGRDSGIFLIPKKVQADALKNMGREAYLKMPKPGTNPRGVEISKRAVSKMIENKETLHIGIEWKRCDISYKTYERWLEYWNE